jgi:hypothetical protein
MLKDPAMAKLEPASDIRSEQRPKASSVDKHWLSRMDRVLKIERGKGGYRIAPPHFAFLSWLAKHGGQ